MSRRHLRPLPISLLVVVVVTVAACGGVARPERASAPHRDRARNEALSTTTTDPPYRPAPVVLDAPVPVRIRVPAIGVDSALVSLHVLPDRRLEVPGDFAVAGWYADGPAPGATGPAVIAGHVDSAHGPAVFFRLAELRPGDPIRVDRADGSVARFAVDRLVQVPKSAFPTDTVFGPTPRSELRLVTCGGTFDHRSGHYRDNVVAFARLVQ